MDVFIGDNFANTIVGTQYEGIIKGRGGDDRLVGQGGKDIIHTVDEAKVMMRCRPAAAI